MIYFDNAASGGYKPQPVLDKVHHALTGACANPGRSGHQKAVLAASLVAEAREKVSQFFGLRDGNVCFGYNCTFALNQAIFGVLNNINGGHVVTTALEHNSVARPLFQLHKSGKIKVSVISPAADGYIKAKDIIAAIQSDTIMVIVNHISNVTGAVAPIEEIGAFTSRKGIIFLVDGAQSGGYADIDMDNQNIDMLAIAPHKGLAAPQGVGALLAKSKITLSPLVFGGTGTQSESLRQPDILPESLESGTAATPAIAGLSAGIDYVKEIRRDGVKKIAEISSYIYERLSRIEEVKLYTPKGCTSGVISFNIGISSSGTIANILDENYSICVRAGLHCAPLAHQYLKTAPDGAVRASISYQNTMQEAETFVIAIEEIVKRLKE